MDGMAGSRVFQTPPKNIEAEMALLGAILVNNRAWDRVVDFLKPEHFADPIHGRIFEACGQAITLGTVVDATTLLHVFATDPQFENIGGAEYVARLARSSVTVVNAADYGRLIHDLHLRRRLIDAAEDVITSAYDTRNEASAPQQIDLAHQLLEEIGTTASTRRPVVTIADAVARALLEADRLKEAREKGEQIPRVSSGLAALDEIIGGFSPGELIVLAGATSAGKTACAIGIALAESQALKRAQLYEGAAQPPGLVYFQSNEMRDVSLGERVAGSLAEVAVHRIHNAWFHQDERDRLEEEAGHVRGLPLYLDDNPSTGVSGVRRRALELRRLAPLRLIVVDYLQLLIPDEKSQNRVNEVAAITRSLKVLAGELQVPVLALSQLSRAVGARENHRPQLSDLRESGSIEQDADTVLFCFRPDYYEAKEKRPVRKSGESRDEFKMRMTEHEADVRGLADQAEIIVAKQRQGVSDKSAMVRWEGGATRFVDQPGREPQGEGLN